MNLLGGESEIMKQFGVELMLGIDGNKLKVIEELLSDGNAAIWIMTDLLALGC